MPKTPSPGRSAVRLRLPTLTLIRWIALTGQAVALSFVYFGLGLDIPFVAAMAVVLGAGAVNVAVALQRQGVVWLKAGEAAGLLAFDLLQLALLLGLTGGLANPFAILMLAPVATAAWALPARMTGLLALLATALVSALALWSLPLPWPGSEAVLPPYYKIGVWTALVVAIVFVAAYVASTAREAAHLTEALGAAQSALDREQRLSALGGLAAAAAHELGSPLATLTVVAGELARDLPPDSPWRDDIQLLRQETERCRQILAELTRRPAQDGGAPYNRLPFETLVEAAAEPYGREEISLLIHTVEPQEGTIPQVPRDPQVLHGLGTVIENGIEFAASKVEISIQSDGTALTLSVSDDGPGFDLSLLSRLGEPYFTTGARGRPTAATRPHTGLGLFIARTLLARSGAVMTFANRAGSGGAEVTLRWPNGIVGSGMEAGMEDSIMSAKP